MQTLHQKKCKNCGVVFTPKQPLQNCCTYDCFIENQNRKAKEKAQKIREKETLVDSIIKSKLKKCRICGTNFLAKRISINTCLNDQCRKEVRKEQTKVDYEKHKQRYKEDAKKQRYSKQCKVCGKEFMAYSKKLVYCCNKCQIKALKIERIGENNPAYRNGMYKKGADYTNHSHNIHEFRKNCQIQNQEMESKYGYRFCQNCGINNSLRWEHHHIIFRSEKPKHEKLHDIRNIIHLCIKCHNKFHKVKSLRIPLIHERKLTEFFGEEILFIK